MLKSIRLLLNRTNNVKRSSYIWNSVNATFSAAESALILMVLNRTNGTYDAGIFSIAYAIGSLMLHIGQFGIRKFQSSDVMERYSFNEYYGMRIITCIAMMLASLGYCIYGTFTRGYSPDKFIVIMLMCFVRCIQAFSDVFHGRMEQKARLDVATKCSFVRYVMEVVSFSVMLIITHNLIISALACTISSFVIFLFTSLNAAADYCELKPGLSLDRFKRLFLEGLPLFLSLFLNMYLSNAPKYAIDAYLTEEIQATYNLIFMPAYVVQLVALFIFNPILTTYAELWVRKEMTTLRRLIRRQILVIIGLTILGLAVAATIGIPVLSLVFNAELKAYKRELCIVMIGGGMLAFSVFFTTVITIIRLHNTLIISYGIAALAAYIFSGIFVKNQGILGAALLYAVIMTVLTIILGIILFAKLHTQREKDTGV